jgi:hypothetical protein
MSSLRGAAVIPLPYGAHIPGTPAPCTGARVVAILVPNPSSIRIDRDAQDAHAPGSAASVRASQPCRSGVMECTEFKPYVTTSTGERAVTPFHVDPFTGARRSPVRLTGTQEFVPEYFCQTGVGAEMSNAFQHTGVEIRDAAPQAGTFATPLHAIATTLAVQTF